MSRADRCGPLVAAMRNALPALIHAAREANALRKEQARYMAALTHDARLKTVIGELGKRVLELEAQLKAASETTPEHA